MSYDTRDPICKACRRFRPCPGNGPSTPSRFLFLGEGPGETEDWKRIPFVGPSGRELDYQYLPLSGLVRPEVYVTNAIKCRQGSGKGDNPDPSEVLTCALHHLPGELARIQPETIVTMGATALRLFGHHHLELVHGRPLPNQRFAQWEGTVFPIYHPAAGLRKSEYIIEIRSDFEALRKYRLGRLHLPVDQYPNPIYRCLNTWSDWEHVIAQAYSYHNWDFRGLEMAVDTETDLGKFWCLTFSMIPGTGYMIRSTNHDLLHKFRLFLSQIHPLIIFHNRLFDGPVLAQAEIYCPRWIDTMQRAFRVPGMPLALKTLAYRYLGMEMEEYEDLVYPWAKDKAIEYLYLGSKTRVEGFVEGLPWKEKVLKCSGGKKWGGKHTSQRVVFQNGPETLGCPVCGKPKHSGNVERDKGGRQFIWDRAAAILEDVMEKDANPIKRWGMVPKEEREVMERVIGEMAKPSISQVPFELVERYACRDPDATLRIRGVIRAEGAAAAQAARGKRGRQDGR